MVEALSVLAAASMAIGTSALIVLHILPTGYDPLRAAVSDYAIGRHRRWFWVFTTAGALSGLALGLALSQSVPSKPALAVAMLFLSAVARLVIPLFPTDQHGSRFQTPKGTIHMVLAVTIFASIAVAASSLGGVLANEAGWQPVKGLVAGWLPWAITVTAIAVAIAVRAPRLNQVFGLVERLYYLTSITWFFVVSIELARLGG